VHDLSIDLQFQWGTYICTHSHRHIHILIDSSCIENRCSNYSCRTYLRRKSRKLHACCLYAFPKERRPCKILWEPFLLGSSQRACYALLSCMVWHVNTDTLFILHFFQFSLNPLPQISYLCNLLGWYLPLLTGISQCRFWSWSRRWYPYYLSKRRGKVWCTLNFGFRDATGMLWILISLWFFVYSSLLIMQMQRRD
jgi:hypothetical protein